MDWMNQLWPRTIGTLAEDGGAPPIRADAPPALRLIHDLVGDLPEGLGSGLNVEEPVSVRASAQLDGKCWPVGGPRQRRPPTPRRGPRWCRRRRCLPGEVADSVEDDSVTGRPG